MDAELADAVNACPQGALKQNYAGLATGGAIIPMSTNAWWGTVAFGPIQVKADRLARTATVVVMSYEEAGEL
jgi:hypothetical protein